MRTLGAVTNAWKGELTTAVATALRDPEVIIGLEPRWLTVANLEQRLREPMVIAPKLCDSTRFDRDPDRFGHRSYSHQPSFAHLDVRSERRADESGREEERS